MEKHVDNSGTYSTRSIKIFGSKTRKIIQSAASTWGQLQEDLQANEISFRDMKATIGKQKTILEYPQAQLPVESFTLYIMPRKTKSGINVDTMDYRAIRKTISDITKQSKEGYNFFNDGDNYTRKSKDTLKQLLKDWLESHKEEDKVVIERASNDTVSIKGIMEMLEQFKAQADDLTLYNLNSALEYLDDIENGNVNAKEEADWGEAEKEYAELMGQDSDVDDEDDDEDEW